MMLTNTVHLQEGIKVLVNPSQQYFDQFHEWVSETEGWRYRPAEYSIWKSTFENFWFFLAIDEETNKIISGVGIAKQYSIDDQQPIYIVGNYYCVPKWRGKGVSNKLFKMAMTQAGENNCALLGAPRMSPLYASRFNFSLINGYWLNFGAISSQHILIPQQVAGFDIREIEDNDWSDIFEYDEKISKLDRHAFIRTSLSDNSTISRICRSPSGKIAGFGAVKKVMGDEVYLSPLYADNFDAALSIVSCLLESIPVDWVYSTVNLLYPETNSDISKLLDMISGHRFKYHNEYRNQYTKRRLEYPLEKVWACEDSSHGLV